MFFQSMEHTQITLPLFLKTALKSSDQAKLRGYGHKWVDAKYILGCAFYVDLLSLCAVFSKILQSDDLDVLAAFMSLLRTVKEINKLNSLPFGKMANLFINSEENPPGGWGKSISVSVLAKL